MLRPVPMIKHFWHCLVLVTFWNSLTAHGGATLDVIGVSALRAITTNLDGRGIRVAQPEASGQNDTNFEVNPNFIGQPQSLFTYISAAGTDTNFPNLVGGYSGHAKDVGNTFYSPIFFGVATNLAHVDNFDANYFYTNYIGLPSLTAIGDAIVNQSFTFGNVVTNLPTPANQISVADQQQVDSEYDNYAEQNHTLFISAVNNGGSVSPPGTAYNSIGVAAFALPPYGGSSSIGPTVDNGRCKPDITAPADYTSFSTPQIAGTAALLLQAGLRGDGGSDTNAAADIRVLKALLLNGAVKPMNWTNGAATPLDARYGAGVVNVLNTYQQLAGGKHGYTVSVSVSTGAAHPPTGATGTVSVLSGWDFNTNSSSVPNDGVNHYYFNVTNSVAGQKFLATATLTWNRHYNATYLISPASINDLNLFLYNCANSNLVMCSTSLVDNVEHLYVTNLAQGRYDLQVLKRGGLGTVSNSEAYALAFEFVAPPLLTVSAGTNSGLGWPIYPAGFLVEARTNLLAGAWQTNGVPEVIFTNGQSNIRLSTTNAQQFFRLRRPHF